MGGIVLFSSLIYLKEGFHVGAEAEIEIAKSKTKAIFLVILVGYYDEELTCFVVS